MGVTTSGGSKEVNEAVFPKQEQKPKERDKKPAKVTARKGHVPFDRSKYRDIRNAFEKMSGVREESDHTGQKEDVVDRVKKQIEAFEEIFSRNFRMYSEYSCHLWVTMFIRMIW